jgi:hypothetical protein
MNNFVPRTDPVASVSSAKGAVASIRDASAVRPVTPIVEAENRMESQLTDRSAAVASYARLTKDIADTLASLRDQSRSSSGQAVNQAESGLLSFMPAPVVMLPMPPTDQKMVEFVAQVAQSVMQQAAQARAAQAHVSPAAVDALLG